MMAFCKPIRDIFHMVYIGFHAFDRDNDRPYTIFWWLVQVFMMTFVGGTRNAYLNSKGLLIFSWLSICTHGLGDGFAEVIGRRFG